MISNRSVAKQISDLMLQFSAQMDGSIRTVQEQCSPQEFKTYSHAAARVLGEILLEALNPLYAEHPDLKPPGLD